MPRILIIGGYGAFGSRAAERLAREPDIDLVVGGRSEPRAREAAAMLSAGRARPVAHAVLDAATVSADELRQTSAAVVINASGPFQGRDYALARACIAAGIHYIDLADARPFVTGITALDANARAAGVLVVSGASSVPGLSSAVVDHFVPEFAQLASVSHGISPGNSFDPGLATAASIIGAVGTPLEMPTDGEKRRYFGWQPLQRHRFPGIGKRWMGACDVPDLALFPLRYRGISTVHFTAGVEVGLFHLGIWAMSWLVRSRLIRTPSHLAGVLLAVKRRLSFLGSDQGGMFVSMRGIGMDGAPALVDWHLEARSGHGPYIPAMPSVILARKLALGQLDRRGATPCLGLFTLDEFMREVADLDIRATDSRAPLYRRVLGDAYDTLPEQVGHLHDVHAPTRWTGEADIDRGTSLLARIGAALTGLPPSGRAVPLSVSFQRDGREEIWIRDFAGHIFRSRQGEQGSGLWETLGPVRLKFDLKPEPDGLRLVLTSLRVLGLPWPRALLPVTIAREWQDGDRFRFTVDVQLPLGSRLVRYAGWLRPAG